MAKNLLRSGCKLNVFNRSIHKANSLKEFGAEISETIAELVKNSEVIITMLTDDAAVDQVMGDTDFIDNLIPKKAGDFDGDGFQEIYWKTYDETSYMRTVMHADGNIQYANYQSEDQMKEYLTTNGNVDSINEII